VINISNYAVKDNPRQGAGLAGGARGPGESRDPRDSRAYGRPAGRGKRRTGQIWAAFALAAGVALDWLAYFVRRCGDRRFAANDTEAYWWGWQITKTHGGLGRSYRDIRFDTLADGEVS
jgi:hypothetical protein